MLWRAWEANFANLSLRTNKDICFHDMLVKTPKTELKSVTHVYAHCVTHVRAPCREGPTSSPSCPTKKLDVRRFDGGKDVRGAKTRQATGRNL
jgi:hypothetical protein